MRFNILQNIAQRLSFIILVIILIQKTVFANALPESEGKYLLIVASLRKSSINAQLMNLVINDLKRNNIDYELLNLNEFIFPAYNEDKLEENLPLAQNLIKVINNAKAVIIACPDYTKSIPGFFKNIVDWIAIDNGAFYQKPILLISASISSEGGVSALIDLQKLLTELGAYVYPKRFPFTNRESKKPKEILKMPLQQHRLLIKRLDEFYKYVNKFTIKNLP